MSPKNRCTRLGLVTGPIVTLALLAVSGCSGEPSADAGTAESVGAADQIITEEEIAELRNSSESRQDFRRELNLMIAERSGVKVIRKTVKGKTASKGH